MWVQLLWRFALVGTLFGGAVANFAKWRAQDRSGEAVLRRSVAGSLIGLATGAAAGVTLFVLH